MCFSATASFAAAGTLSIAGILALKHAGRTNKRWYAAIPLLFGIQQAIEGIEWLLVKPSPTCNAFGYGFLFFAFLLWPVYIPFAVWMMETVASRKRLFKGITILGAVSSFVLLGAYLTYPLTVNVLGHRLDYAIAVPWQAVGVPIYVFCVCSGVFSSRRYVRMLGWLVLGGFVLTMFAYRYAFTSVWCFFAAWISMLVVFDIYNDKKIKA